MNITLAGSPIPSSIRTSSLALLPQSQTLTLIEEIPSDPSSAAPPPASAPRRCLSTATEPPQEASIVSQSLYILFESAMGQVLAAVQEKLHGREWREKQIRKITDRVFDRISNDSGKNTLSFEDLYIAVLCVYNDINKHLPGPHNDPPSKEKLRFMMQIFDLNLDGVLDREEFAEFIRKLTADTLTAVSRNMLIALVVAPTVALITKRATEGVPGVGRVVHRLPNSIYASIVTLGVVLLQNAGEG